MKWLTGTVVFLAAMGLVTAEDKLLLKDGQTVTGEILSVTANDVQIDTGEETMRVPRWAIEKMEREGATAENTNSSSKRSRRKLPTRAKVEPTPELNAWIETLVEKLGSDDDGVRLTAGFALRSAGATAYDAVKGASESDNEHAVTAAKRILSHIDFVTEQEVRSQASIHERDNVGELITKVGVTAEQAPLFEKTLTEFYEEQSELAASIRARKIPAEEGGKQLRELRAAVDTKVATILTDEQMKIYRSSIPRSSNRNRSK